MESLQRIAHLLRGRVFPIHEKKRYMNYRGTSNKRMSVWYENKETHSTLEGYEKELISLFGGFLSIANRPNKFLLILDEWEESDNWYYRKDKTLVLTAKGAIETLYITYMKKGMNEEAEAMKEALIKHMNFMELNTKEVSL